MGRRGRIFYKVVALVALGLAFFLKGPASAQDFITATIVVTNVPAGLTSNLVVNATTRYWTNDASASPSTLLQITNTTAWAATNLLNHLTRYPGGNGLFLSQSTETNVVLKGFTLTVTVNGGWGFVSYATNVVTEPEYNVRVPITVEAPTNQTNIASALVAALVNSTNALGTNWTAGSNYLQKGAGPRQYVLSEVAYQTLVAAAFAQITNANLVNATNRGYVVALTNGYWTNGVAANLVTTNATNYGLAFSSPGAYPFSQQFGGGQVGAGYAMAIGEGAFAGTNSLAVGNLASGGHFTVAIGNGADGSVGTNGVAIGQNTSLGASSNAVAIGQGAQVGDRHHGSVALGQGATTTTNLQVMLGSSTHTVIVPGVLQVTAATNTTWRGTNVLNGRLDLVPRANSGLANGYNSGVILGTNVYIRCSGPSGAYTNVGFAAAVDGTWHKVQFDNPGLSLTLLDSSGLEASAGNRILTGTGALLNSTNNPAFAELIYDGSASRWRVVAFR